MDYCRVQARGKSLGGHSADRGYRLMYDEVADHKNNTGSTAETTETKMRGGPTYTTSYFLRC